MSTFKKFDLNQEPLAFEFIQSGIRGLDELFGGGIPYNHLILVEEDEYNIYSNLLLRSISSNAYHEGNTLTYFSDSISSDPSAFIEKLPSRCKLDPKYIYDEWEHLQIAFRYNYMPSLTHETGNIIDFGRLIGESQSKVNKHPDRLSIHSIREITKVMEEYVERSVSTNGKNTNGSSKSSHLVIIDHLSATTSPTCDNICTFFYQLKSMVRQLNRCIVLVTIQSGFLSTVTIKRLRNIVDSSVQLESFDTLKPSVYGDDYKGAFHVHKLTRVSSAKDNLVANYGFQLKKHNRYFIIEKLFLPPDIGDEPSRATTSTKPSNSGDDVF